MLREDLGHIVTSAVGALIQAGELPESARIPVEIQDTKQPEHGDYACNFALAASKQAGMNPRQLAEILRTKILEVDGSTGFQPVGVTGFQPAEGASPSLIHEIEIAGPGFLNFRLRPESVSAYVAQVLELGPRLPNTQHRTPNTSSLRINVEFVSVNPNGPITVGSARGAAFGDTLCRVLQAAGHTVNREYYINDGVNSEQMRLFAESVLHYYRRTVGVESTFPEKGYRGDYVDQVAKDLHARTDPFHAWDEVSKHQIGWWQSKSQEMMLAAQRTDLHAFGVDFDTWFSEQSLHDNGEVARCIDELIANGAADEEPYRVILKLARGGVIEEVNKESQTDAMEEDEEAADEGPDATPTSSSEAQTSSQEEGDRKAADSPLNTQHPTPNTSGSTLWLRATKFGDDMDRVLRRKDGRLTYIASDVAYHKDKFNRPPNADKLITILGPDHHGYIHRLQAVLAALLEKPVGGWQSADVGPDAANSQQPTANGFNGTDAEIYRSAAERDACKSALEEARRKLEVVIFQIVRFVKDGKPAPMRKRDGNIYELRDLITELGQAVAPKASKEEQQRTGADVARFFYLMRSHDSAMDFDIDLATKQSDDNPVFYVQYAHARICSVIRKAGETAGIGVLGYRGIGGEGVESNTLTPQHLNTNLLVHPREQTLIRKILDLPMEVERCVEDYGVHRITTYAIELARTYHHFYDACRVILPEDPELSRARLALCEAARIALKAALDLLGISAPERMDREAPEPDK